MNLRIKITPKAFVGSCLFYIVDKNNNNNKNKSNCMFSYQFDVFLMLNNK